MSQQILFLDPDHICDLCGTAEPNAFLYSINHSPIAGTGLCTSQWLRRNHRRYEVTG